MYDPLIQFFQAHKKNQWDTRDVIYCDHTSQWAQLLFTTYEPY